MRARLLAALLLTLAGLSVAPAPAYACSCAYDEHDPELVRRAEVIFTGTVVGNRTFGQTRTLTFAVERVYKGEVAATQDVKTHVLGATCGLELAGSGPFLIQGGSDPDRPGALSANLCGGSRAEPAPAGLGGGYPPRPGSATSDLTWLPLAGGLASIAAAAVVGLVLRRRGPA